MIADRVTVDIDYYVPNAHLKAIDAYYALKRHALVDRVRVHVSTSGKGVHLQGLLSERLTDSQRDALRRTLHDDQKRADLDVERGEVGHATDIFWSQKDGNDGDREEVEDIWAALDRIEKGNTDGYAQVKALANHGRKSVWNTHGLNRPSLAEASR